MLHQLQHHAFTEENAAAVGQWMYPTVTNYAFACELYLKSLYYSAHQSEHPHTHNLQQLYSVLPDDLRREIAADCKAAHPNIDRNTIHRQLKINKLVFETYRYPNTGKKSSLVFLQAFGEVLKTLAHSKRNTSMLLVAE